MDTDRLLKTLNLKQQEFAKRFNIVNEDDIRTLNHVINTEVGKLMETPGFGCNF
jgi:hypothetical protein